MAPACTRRSARRWDRPRRAKRRTGFSPPMDGLKPVLRFPPPAPKPARLAHPRAYARRMLIAALLFATNLYGPLQPGPHPVGFKVLERYDYSRPYLSRGRAGERA